MGLPQLVKLVNDAQQAGLSSDGTTSATELSFLAGVAYEPRIARIAEIGFNGGFSSFTFLSANPQAEVVSFDLCAFDYSLPAKAHLDELFPGRHTLIPGDSTATVPKFAEENPELRFDLIFIDGGHEYEVARADLHNTRALATEDTILVIDDLTPWKPWGRGPTQAWLEALDAGRNSQRFIVQDGLITMTLDPSGQSSRVWALGGYLGLD
ncbi:MAG TPA: class I SAM-dependent methyltransferase [Pseudonocardiaceae bacterium]|jgi:predicted O-methyltransferase YrrM|nr:class I SAM-dependent methyltransferase [Pseudonocardiaceae bacterium]